MHTYVLFILSLVLLWFDTTTATSFGHQLVVAPGGAATNTCIDYERQALLGFKARLPDPDDLLSTWKPEEEDDCCKWSGVTCSNQTGHVTMLDLADYYTIGGDGGEISLSLLNLTYLNHLDLSNCSFHGTIPHFIGSMTHLTYLDLSLNKFTGTIPMFIGNMTQLIYLDLTDNHFTGSIPMSIGYLTNLTELYLGDNYLSGTIPMSIGSLTKLTHLFLDGNNLTGIIPRSIGSLTKLRGLNLGYNSLHGTIPPEFGNLTNLLSLSLDSFGGYTVENLDWLSSLSSLEILLLDGTSLAKANNWINVIIGLPNLSVVFLARCDLSKAMHPYSSVVNSSSSIHTLSLNDNNLNSSIYSWLGSLVGNRLRYFAVSGNSFDGKLLDFLNNLSRCTSLNMLYFLDVSSNLLTGSLSDDVSNLSMSVEYIDFSSNKLGHPFPKLIQKMNKLMHLDLSNNSFSDTFDTEYWNQWRPSQLRYLDLSFNNISGTLPESLSGLHLEKVDLSSNRFYGPIPTFPACINFLDLSRNKFQGGISFLCQIYDNLEFLDLSRNSLTGQLPDCLKNLVQLKFLNLGHNTLSGYIPPFVGYLGQLETLCLYNNSFSGELPLSLKDCTKLTLLDLGANKLYGNIPVWIGTNLSRLYALSLKSNNFSGAIPLEICQLVSLQILDLSFNNLHGTIPSCVRNLTSMVQKGLFTDQNLHNYLSNASFKSMPYHASYSDDDSYFDHLLIGWQGNVNEFSRNLGLVKTIDLSTNTLTGQIPYEITGLQGLELLNLSRNALLGEIPKDIGQMTELQILDLSKNNFSGGLPSSMSKMNFLNYLDVSHNNLSGRIPSGTQLQTSEPSRYIGNAGLCGPPLTKYCPGDREPEVTPVIDDSKGVGEAVDELERWFYIGGAAGYVTGFSIVFGALLFNRRARHAFFQCHDSLKDWVYVKVMVFMAKWRRVARA
uniref:Uncharacterized protein n=1 Tax=Tanacetum cinerariifolium TaxID=118510 RepID=A0A6L2N1D9_TANCI|nr:hypothetical protein [Tanacetum cinerariifolium]